MRNALSTIGTRRNESGIVNLYDAMGPGTHWVGYAKRNNSVVYFDSFGKLRPHKELMRYFGKRCHDNGVQSHILSELLRTIRASADRCVYSFYKR